jgi:hypothetical protein
MPWLSEFYGIVIAMDYAEHGVPHFHARYADEEASISIQTLDVIAGSLPERALRLVREWATLHRGELEADWELARAAQPLEPIAPLEYHDSHGRPRSCDLGRGRR